MSRMEFLFREGAARAPILLRGRTCKIRRSEHENVHDYVYVKSLRVNPTRSQYSEGQTHVPMNISHGNTSERDPNPLRLGFKARNVDGSISNVDGSTSNVGWSDL